MTKRMLIDATHAEETRVVVLDGSRLEDFDVETSTKKQLKGNIYLAKVVRVEPSLQAAFVEYGGNRHGFLAFGEIHPDYYQIPIADRQRLLALQEAEARAEEEAEERAEAAMRSPSVTPQGSPALPVSPAIMESVEPEGSMPDTSAAEPLAGEPPADALGADLAPEAAEPVAVEAADTIPELAAPALAAAPGEVEPATPDGVTGVRPDATLAEPPIDAILEPIEAAAAPLEERDDDAPEDAQGDDGTEPDFSDSHEVISQEFEAPGSGDHGSDGHNSNGDELSGDDSNGHDTMSGDAPAPETMGGDSEAGEERDERERRIPSRHLRNYKIQEVIRRRQILLIQVVKEERGTKGAALTTYISLAGRFCVLMPNSPRGGGVSRKITSTADRKRLREAVEELEIPRGMGLIVRTAGANRPKPEIKRDCEYLLRLWDDIRETTMGSVAPALINEEASLIKRAIRDVYSRDVDEILVDGESGWRAARDFMRMLMPSHARKVILWQDPSPAGAQSLFARQQVEAQLDAMLSPTVQLRSGGYLVINQTEALVAIDVNSGRSTRERGIEETALRTNLEAADEAARQLRLRDLAGLIVIDFIDMESKKHNAMVERRLKDALKIDRARIQVGTISHFGLMEMSRQRLRPSLAETSFVACPHCGGLGHVRSTESAAMHVLRAIEEEGAKRRAAEIMVYAAGSIALYVLNHKRAWLAEIETRHFMQISFAADDTLLPPAVRIDRLRPQLSPEELPTAPTLAAPVATAAEIEDADAFEADDEFDGEEDDVAEERRVQATPATAPNGAAGANGAAPGAHTETSEEAERRRRRRRRRRRSGRRDEAGMPMPGESGGPMALDAEQPEIGFAAAGDAPATDTTAVAQEAATREQAAEPAGLVVGGVTAGDAEDDEQDGEAAAGEAREEGQEDPGSPLRRRGRRGGRRRRSGIVEDGAPTVEQVAVRVPAYTGPTPADPFGGQTFDIFDVIEQQQALQAAAPRLVAEPSATVVPEAAQPEALAPPALVDEPSALEAAAPEVSAPEALAPHTAAPEALAPEVASPPVPDAVPSPVVAVEAAAAEAPAPLAADPAPPSDAEPPLALAGSDGAEVPAAAVPVKRPRAPRKPRQPKLPVDVPPLVAAEASAPAASVAPETTPEPEPVAAAARAEPVLPLVAEQAMPEPEPVATPVVKPVLVGVDEAPAEKKRGWWRR